VNGDLVLGEFVDTLQDIDFTTIRPVGAVLPPRRPRSTSSRHVPCVKQDKTTLEHFLSVQTNRFSSPAAGVLGRIRFHHRVAFTVGRYKTLIPRLTGVLVIDSPVGRVIVIPEVEIVKEGVSLPVVGHDPPRRRGRGSAR